MSAVVKVAPLPADVISPWMRSIGRDPPAAYTMDAPRSSASRSTPTTPSADACSGG
jgi:hypothetical protein